MKTSNAHRPKRARKSRPDRPKADVSLSRLRSAITNGRQLLADCDHRSARMRRLRDLIAGHVSDLGGRDQISEAEFCLIRRCSLLTLELELLEARFETNDGATAQELDIYQRAAGSLRRLHESLGLRRRSRDVTPHPLDYAKQYDRDAEDAEAEATARTSCKPSPIPRCSALPSSDAKHGWPGSRSWPPYSA